MIPCNNFEQQRIPHPRLVPTASQQFKFIRLLPLQELPPQQVRWQRTYRRLQPQYRTEVLGEDSYRGETSLVMELAGEEALGLAGSPCDYHNSIVTGVTGTCFRTCNTNTQLSCYWCHRFLA